METRESKDLGIGFTNGIDNDFKDGISSANFLCKLAGGYCVDFVHNPTNGKYNDICRYFNSARYNMASNVVPELHKNWDRFFENSSKGFYLQFAHSEGVANVYNALKSYPEDLRKQILVVAIAPSVYIDSEYCGRVWHYTSKRDIVPHLDISGKQRNRHTTYSLSPHPKSHWLDHEFQSPTYEISIQVRIDKYLNGSKK